MADARTYRVLLTAPGRRPQVPAWMHQALVTVATAAQIRRLSRLPELTVVKAREPQTVLAKGDLLLLLADRHRDTPEPAEILFAFEATPRPVPEATLVEMLKCFDRPKAVEFAWGAEQAAFAMSEALAKIVVAPARSASAVSESVVRRLDRQIEDVAKMWEVFLTPSLVASAPSEAAPEHPASALRESAAEMLARQSEVLAEIVASAQCESVARMRATVEQLESTIRLAVDQISTMVGPVAFYRMAGEPLGRLQSVISATADLRAASGRLSARKLADVFGLSLSALASLIGRPRQTLWRTDDSEAIQASLAPFESIARLRTVLSNGEFRHWLNMPNDQLDQHTPLEIIRDGRVGVVADLAADMLTGSPA